VNSKEAFGVTIFQPAVATQKKKETNFHTLRRRLTEYTTYYEISEEGKKKKRIKKRSECFFPCVQKQHHLHSFCNFAQQETRDAC